MSTATSLFVSPAESWFPLYILCFKVKVLAIYSEIKRKSPVNPLVIYLPH